ncbi:MAG: CBS domain-containing protein [Thermoflexales bacterium]|nr:CBS domain-containing protein [Thermoflexales bacterium]
MPETIILTHENADFDAVASQLGAALLYPEAVPVLPRRCNRNVKAFVSLYRDDLPFVEAAELKRQRIDRVILVDTQNLVSIRGVSAASSVHVLDHHPRGELPPAWTFSGELLGATTTLLVEDIIDGGLRPTPVQATLLLLGIYEDTGSLSYMTTTPRDLRAAAWLLEHGANLEVVNSFLHHPLAESQRQLYEQLLEAAQTHEIAGHQVVIAAVETKGYAEEISTLAHQLRDLLDPDALFVLVAFNSSLQVVARSTTDAIDVGAVALHLGGGGHSRAAAALIRDRSLDGVQAELLDILPRFIRPAITVASIMSRGVQTLPPDTPVSQAARQMQRTGHEGYPVVREGKVIGLLTRRVVDRSMQHGLGNQAVERVMERGELYVSPDDPVEKLEKLMIAHGWGQVPVVREGEVTGIVTRTDLIKLWATPRQPARQAQVAAMLERAIVPDLLALVRQIAAIANQMGSVAYFVGGVVRDLLLDFPIADVDLVIEGDAIALARQLVLERGGRIKSHGRFGTAKWLFDSYSIDLVTARTEFYAHPSALPQVERSSIKQDLHRRDFTINTLAICLDPDRFGELLDFYGGERDLHEGLIRVLHSLSFVEDPTRMLRAARLEQRLGFQIEARTWEQLLNSLDLLDRVSGDRIRHEINLIFQEARPEDALCRLQQLGILPHIYAGLTCDEWMCTHFEQARQTLASSQDIWPWASQELAHRNLRVLTGLVIMCYRLKRAGLEAVITRLKIPRADADALREVDALKAILPDLAHHKRPSAIYRALSPYSLPALFATWLVSGDQAAADQIRQYVDQLRLVRPTLSGSDLRQQFGVAPGPRLGQLLDALRDAVLDGQASTREEEEALVRERIEMSDRDVR